MKPSRSLKSEGQKGSHFNMIIFEVVLIIVNFSSLVSPKTHRDG